jgi:hypothetical protein
MIFAMALLASDNLLGTVREEAGIMNKDRRIGQRLTKLGAFLMMSALVVGVVGIVKPGHDRPSDTSKIVKPGHKF